MIKTRIVEVSLDWNEIVALVRAKVRPPDGDAFRVQALPTEFGEFVVQVTWDDPLPEETKARK